MSEDFTDTATAAAMTPQALAEALLDGARGAYGPEAAVRLLLGVGMVGKVRHLISTEPSATSYSRNDRAWVDWSKVPVACGALSGGELRLLALCSSLAGECKVELADVVAGLDRANLDLVLAAIAHAGGSHEHSDIARTPAGEVDLVRFESLHPWPNP